MAAPNAVPLLRAIMGKHTPFQKKPHRRSDLWGVGRKEWTKDVYDLDIRSNGPRMIFDFGFFSQHVRHGLNTNRIVSDYSNDLHENSFAVRSYYAPKHSKRLLPFESILENR
jgi:hypothetical protein